MSLRYLSAVVFVFGLLTLFAEEPLADERQDATAAAQGIMSALSKGQFNQVWDKQMSIVFSQTMTKDSFLANMSIGRTPMGNLTDSRIVDVNYSQEDAQTGFKGDIWAITFLNTYRVGKFYERVVVVKDGDGAYRLAGLWGSPAPTQ